MSAAVGVGVAAAVVFVGSVIYFTIEYRRCRSTADAVVAAVPSMPEFTGGAWPQTSEHLMWINDLFMHCVWHCYITARWGRTSSHICQRLHGDDPEERRVDEIGRQLACSGASIEQCANACRYQVPPFESAETGCVHWNLR